MVHTWGIVGAHFLRNYAPLNHLFISKINQKGVEGHSFFCFYIVLPNHNLTVIYNIDSLGGRLDGETTAAEVVPGS